MKSLIIGQIAGPIIRHGATVLGGWLLASGYADETSTQEVVGGLIALGGIVLSFAEKEMRT